MRKRKVRKIVIIVLSIILSLIVAERLYNSRAEFQTTAEDASYYGIIDAKLTTREKLKDFEYLYNVLKENFPFFETNKKLHGIDWLGNKNKYKRIIRNTKNDAEYLVALSKIIKELNDGHTYVMTGDIYSRWYKHNHGYWHEVLMNKRSMARYGFDLFDGDIDDIELDPNSKFLIRDGPVLETKVLIENKIAYMKIEAMSFYHISEDYPIIKDFLIEIEDYEKLIIDIRGNGGGRDQYWKNIVGLLSDRGYTYLYYSLFKQTSKTKHDFYKIPGIKTIDYLDEKVLENLPPEIKEEFGFFRPYVVRVNAGDPWEEINFNGKVYLLVDEGTGSAADNFAAFAKDTGFATLVGEPTSGTRANAHIPMVSLPISGFVVNYSRDLVLNADGTINMETKTTPHILVDDPTYNEDFTKDKCIQAVIEDNI